MMTAEKNFADSCSIKVPRRHAVRLILKAGIAAALAVLADVAVEGLENFPEEGPVLVVANHFNFLDPVLLIRYLPRQTEFIGGITNPYAPGIVTFFPKLYGFFPVRRGAFNRDHLLLAQSVLEQGGVLSGFPEAGSWAQTLRRARPGIPMVASRSRAVIQPVGLSGVHHVFPSLKKRKRARVLVKFGKPFGPFFVSERGETDRQQLDRMGDEMMNRIAALLPDELRGCYSSDPAVRCNAEMLQYPWKHQAELE